MIKLINPYEKLDKFQCFGCSKNNQHGLQMDFFETEEEIIAEINVKDFHQGYFDILHGGIQSTILDEIACWVVYIKGKTAGVTSKLEVKYRNPILVTKGVITAKARLVELNRRVATVKAELYNNENKIGAEAEVQYFIFPEKIAKEKLKFPGAEAFYETVNK